MSLIFVCSQHMAHTNSDTNGKKDIILEGNVCGGKKFGERKHEKTIFPMDKVQLNGINHGGN